MPRFVLEEHGPADIAPEGIEKRPDRILPRQDPWQKPSPEKGLAFAGRSTIGSGWSMLAPCRPCRSPVGTDSGFGPSAEERRLPDHGEGGMARPRSAFGVALPCQQLTGRRCAQKQGLRPCRWNPMAEAGSPGWMLRVIYRARMLAAIYASCWGFGLRRHHESQQHDSHCPHRAALALTPPRGSEPEAVLHDPTERRILPRSTSRYSTSQWKRFTAHVLCR